MLNVLGCVNEFSLYSVQVYHGYTKTNICHWRGEIQLNIFPSIKHFNIFSAG